MGSPANGKDPGFIFHESFIIVPFTKPLLKTKDVNPEQSQGP